MLQAIGKFLGGSGGLLVAGGLGGMAIGASLAGVWNAANATGQYRKLAETSSAALERMADTYATLVLNAGRREMNYLYTLEEQTAACTATVTTFQGWATMSAEERAAAQARAAKLAADNQALSSKYEGLKKSYENGDKSVVGWLRGNLLPDLCIVRYGAEACRADPFAAAGYPDAGGGAGAVAKPPK